MTTDLIPDFYAALPEIILLIMACVLLLLSIFKRYKEVNFIYNVSIAVLIIVVGMVALVDTHSQTAFNDMYAVNSFTQLYKIVSLTLSLVVMVIIPPTLRKLQIYKAEIPILILMANIAMMIMVSANNFLILYLGIELLSITLYILISMSRHNILSTEAGLKYFVLSSLASIFILYGISLIYGLTGSIFYNEIAMQLLKVSSPNSMMLTGFIMIIIGVGFKLSFVPFHMWTPDVFQGSPTPITVFLATAPKVATVGVLIQLLYTSFQSLIDIWQPLIMALAVLSIGLGAVAALFQINIKRLIAYSSISHMGYVALALLMPTPFALSKIIIYMVVYSITIIGVFIVLMLLNRQGKAIEDIDGLKGLSQDIPLLSFAFAILLFSLAGIPPFAGFFIKLNILQVALEAGYTGSVILAVLFSVISAAYYLKVIKCIYFDEPLGGAHALRIERNFSLIPIAVLIIIIVMTTIYVLLPINQLTSIDQASTAILPANF